MAALLRNTVLTACTLLLLAGICWGKEVYLKDGGIIDCQSFWKRGKVVVVKINRDTMLEFRQSEIDLKRTFKTTGKKAHHIKRKKTSRHARNHVKAAQPVIDSAPAAPAA